jgi:hypothetical protein
VFRSQENNCCLNIFLIKNFNALKITTDCGSDKEEKGKKSMDSGLYYSSVA